MPKQAASVPTFTRTAKGGQPPCLFQDLLAGCPRPCQGREYTSNESMNSGMGVPRSLRFLQGAGLVNHHILGMQFLLAWQDAKRSEAILRGWRPALYHLQLL